MNLSKLSPKYRFAIALGASLGMGNVMFQACTRNLGPTAGLAAGLAAVTMIAFGIFVILEGFASRQTILPGEESPRESREYRLWMESLDRK